MLGHLSSTLDEIIETTRVMDIDSQRFVDYIMLHRAKDGLQRTGSARYLISNTDRLVTMDGLIERLPSNEIMLKSISSERSIRLILDDVVIHDYFGDKIFRRFIIEGRSVALMISISIDNEILALSVIGCHEVVCNMMRLYREMYPEP